MHKRLLKQMRIYNKNTQNNNKEATSEKMKGHTPTRYNLVWKRIDRSNAWNYVQEYSNNSEGFFYP